MWWKSAKIYELYIDKFAGTIRGLTNKLDYFPALGVNALHILPHYPSPMVDDGYDVAEYCGVRPELGTLEDFKILLAEAKRRNIRIIVDLVLNHTSRNHPWFEEARVTTNNPKRDYYLWSADTTRFAGATNGLPDMKPHNWIYNSETDDHYFATFYPGQPDLNWDNDEVFQEFTSIISFWAGLGVAGFRLDAAPYLIKRDGTTSKGLPETHAVLKKLRAWLDEHHPGTVLLAEAHQTLELSKSYFGQDDECHLVYHFTLMEQLWMAAMERAEGKRADASARITRALGESADIPENCQWATFVRNHDEVSLATLAAHEREELVEFLDPGRQYPFNKGATTSVRVATALKENHADILELFQSLYSASGAPVMYYGDECGMTNVHNPAFMTDTRRHVRGDFLWERAKAQMAEPRSLWQGVARIIQTSGQGRHTSAHGAYTHVQGVRTRRARGGSPGVHDQGPYV